MNIPEMIKEWRKGCSCGPHNPANCPDCTTALIDAIDRELIKLKCKEFDIYECLESGKVSKFHAIGIAKYFKLTTEDLK